MKTKITGLVIIFVFAASGCLAKQSLVPTLTISSVATLTKKPLLSPTSTHTPSLTYTLVPSLTKSPTSTISPTDTPTIIPTETPSPYPTRPPWDQIFISKDKKYVAKLFWRYESTDRQTIELSDSDGNILWLIPFQGELPAGDPQRYLSIYKWGNNSKYLYFYYSFSYDGAHTLWNGFDLQKIDVETGKITQVIPSSELVGFSISPSGKQIAFIRQEDKPRQLVIKNFSSGIIKRTTIYIETEKFVQGGWIYWSPNEEKIIFHIANGEWILVYLLDVETMQKDVVLEYWVEEIWFNGWTDGGNLQFVTYPKYEIIEIDVDTKEQVIIGTVTPTPGP